MRILDFSDGHESSAEPTITNLAASNITNTPSGNLAATNVQTALNELQSDIDTRATSTDISTHLSDPTDAHDASAISNAPSGNLAATDVQSALNELQGDVNTINSSKGAANGIATLDSGGKVPLSQIPQTALVDVFVVADITARDALTVEEGDVAVVTDAGGGITKTYMYNGTSWTEIITDGSVAAHMADSSDAHAASAITNTPSGNLAATNVQTALNELQSDIDTRALNSSLTTHTGASTGVHGVTGAVVGTTDTQALTNKDYDGGTASNTSRITIPKATKATLDALTRKEGTVVYATDEDKLYYDDGSTLLPIGAGGGTGINFIDNGDAETTTTIFAVTKNTVAGTAPDGGFVSGGTNILVSRETSSPLIDTAHWRITKDGANRQGEQASIPFTIDEGFRNLKHRIRFYGKASANYTGSSGTEYLTCYIWDVTNNTLISTSNVNVPQGSTPVDISFDATSASSYKFVLHVAGTGTATWTFDVDNIQVGPQELIHSPAIGDWNSTLDFTPNSASFGTVSGEAYATRRVGDTLEVIGYFVCGSVAGDIATIDMPTGYTIDTSKLPPSDTGRIGNWESCASGSAANYDVNNRQGPIIFDAAFPNRVSLSKAGTLATPLTANVNTIIGSGDGVIFNFNVPITNWSSNIQLANSRVEYASNSGMGDAADTTSFVNDPIGNLIPQVTYTTNRFKRVRFKNPIQTSDTVQMQISTDSGITWNDVTGLQDSAAGASNVQIWQYQNGVQYGIGRIRKVTSSTTDLDIGFGQYKFATGATYGAAGENWVADTAFRWRVVKYSNAVPVEASTSLPYASGYHSTDSSWTNTTTGSVYQSPSNDASSTFTQQLASGITITSTGANTPGIVFTSTLPGTYLCMVKGNTSDTVVAVTHGFRLNDGSGVMLDETTVEINTVPSRGNWTLAGMQRVTANTSTTFIIQMARFTASAGTQTLQSSTLATRSLTWVVRYLGP